MRATRDWITEFMLAHKERFRPFDWPEPDTEGWDDYERDWVVAFLKKDVREEEATEASRRLVTAPPQFKPEHIPLVLGAVETMRREKAGDGAGDDREIAKTQSRECAHCSGNGIAVVWNPYPGQNPKVPDHASALCVCPYGRWLKRYYANHDGGAMLRRFVDLADVHNRRSGWCATPPGDEAFAGVTDDDDLAF